MKKIKSLFILAVLMLSVSALYAQKSQVKFIGIHIGNEDNMSVLDKSAFPDFEFYSNNAELKSYSEAQKMVGNPKYLMGFYGEVPETMGFCANYRGDLGKRYSLPYATGALFVIDAEGTIGYQSKPNSRSEMEYQQITHLVKRFKKGKNAKKLKSSKQKYIKESPVGELEKTKGADYDKNSEGLVGWDIPEISLKNEQGEETTLSQITEGQVCVVVFFTLNGAHWIKATAKGDIEKEWDGGKLVAPKDNIFEKQFNEGEYETKAEAKKGFAKAMFKGVASSNGLLALLVLDKEELSEVEKLKAYGQAVTLLAGVQKISKDLKR